MEHDLHRLQKKSKHSEAVKCCENCFTHKHLKKRISNVGEMGECDFCGEKDVFTITARELYEDFAAVLALYEPTGYGQHYHPEMGIDADEVGDLLPQLIQEDWGIDIFNYGILDPTKQCDLLDEIRAGSPSFDYKMPGESSGEFWSSKTKNFTHISEADLWYGFCEYIKHSRRFLIAKNSSTGPMSDPQDWLPGLLTSVKKTKPVGSIMFRARPNEVRQTKPYPAVDMGAPPIEKTVSGRINSAGIRVLYVALEKATAVSEVRPEKGAHVSVALLRTRQEVNLIDLTSEPIIPSPFGYTKEQLLEQLERNAFLRCLNEALSRPVRKQEAEIEYVPTQYIAEVIKAAGYDGIIYKSSLAEEGQNIVLFDPSVVDIDPNTELVKVTNVVVDFERVNLTTQVPRWKSK